MPKFFRNRIFRFGSQNSVVIFIVLSCSSQLLGDFGIHRVIHFVEILTVKRFGFQLKSRVSQKLCRDIKMGAFCEMSGVSDFLSSRNIRLDIDCLIAFNEYTFFSLILFLAVYTLLNFCY